MTEAGDVLLDCAIDSYYYDDNRTDEEFFSDAFRDSAINMEVTRSPWIAVLIVFGSHHSARPVSGGRHAKKQKNPEGSKRKIF